MKFGTACGGEKAKTTRFAAMDDGEESHSDTIELNILQMIEVISAEEFVASAKMF